MKKFKGFVYVVLVFVFLGVFSACGAITGGGNVTAEAFARLENGMSIREVQDILGTTPTSESTMEMLGITTTTMMWTGRGFSSITVIFTNGYATAISQIGLETTSGATQAVNSELNNDITDVTRIRHMPAPRGWRNETFFELSFGLPADWEM